MLENDTLLEFLAKTVGSSENALRLLLSILAGYPISIIHRNYFYDKPPNIQYWYFIVTGFLIGWFNFGADMIHPIAAIVITYTVLFILGGGTLSLTIVFVYNMAHLLIGYWVTATGDYDIKWTMPQCVLTLRLIGLAFNVADGTKPEEKLSAANKKVVLRVMPTALEVLAHNLYPPSFLIGPQLPLTRLRSFVDHSLRGEEGDKLPDSVRAGLLRGGLGAIYLVIHLLGAAFVTDEYILSAEFAEGAMWKKLILLGLWGRIALYKYICCWLLTEGACIVMGLTYNGKDSYGQDKWDGCTNVRIHIFESTTRMNDYIASFNINTNDWVAQYIYKRLAFLNNRNISLLGVLFFLAVWHGFHSGYYATFFFEFISTLAEKEVTTTAEKYPSVTEIFKRQPASGLLYVLLRIYTFTSMGYAMTAFILLKHRKYLQVYGIFYYGYHIFYLALILGLPLARKFIFPPTKRKEAKAE